LAYRREAELAYNLRGPIDRFQAVHVRRNGFILAALLAGSGLFASAGVDVDLRQGFPLLPGTQWVYRGYVRSHVEGSTIGRVTGVTWTMSVERTVERDGISAAVVRGFPSDLDWSAGDAKPRASVLVETRGGKFYLNSQDNVQPVLDQIDDPKYSLGNLTTDDDLVFQLPLAAGKKFCDEQAMRREDGMYCWVASGPHAAALDHVAGVAPGARAAFDMEFNTLPDDCEFEFVEGVGITRYEYHHHGTIADTELRLVEFHAAETAAAR
jgi:hypothetical protein